MSTFSVSLAVGKLEKYREVNAVDAADPVDKHEGVNLHGYRGMLLDVAALAGGDMAAAPITVRPMFWSEAAGKFVVDVGVPAQAFAAPGQMFVDNVHDRVVWVKVTTFAGGYTARISIAPAKPELTQD
jgi:hypothetical protein